MWGWMAQTTRNSTLSAIVWNKIRSFILPVSFWDWIYMLNNLFFIYINSKIKRHWKNKTVVANIILQWKNQNMFSTPEHSAVHNSWGVAESAGGQPGGSSCGRHSVFRGPAHGRELLRSSRGWRWTGIHLPLRCKHLFSYQHGVEQPKVSILPRGIVLRIGKGLGVVQAPMRDWYLPIKLALGIERMGGKGWDGDELEPLSFTDRSQHSRWHLG